MLNVAICIDGSEPRQWEADCAARVSALEGVQVTQLLVRTGGEAKPAKRAARLLERYLSDRAASMKRVPASRALPDVPPVDIRRGESLPERLPGNVPDVILVFGTESFDTEGTDWARCAVWRFRFEAQAGLSASKLLLLNLLQGRHTAAVSLTATGGAYGAGAVLKRGTFATGIHSFENHLNQLNRLCGDWAVAACRERLAKGAPRSRPGGGASAREAAAAREDGFAESEPEFEAEAGCPGLGSKPLPHPLPAVSLRQTMRLAARVIAGKGRRWFARSFKTERWNVGIIRRPIQELLSAPVLPAVEWLPPRTNFLADPFGVQVEGKLVVLAEEFDYASGKGVIAGLYPDEIDRGGGTARAIELPVHLSYPFIVRHGSDIYCIPESCQAKEVALFRAVDFPSRWEKAGTLIDHFAAVDATVFEHDGRWWLICTSESEGWNSHLYIWHASDLFGEWKPHANNPVKMDVRSARPAGTPFYLDGALYRPAQDCSATYGGGVVLNRIAVLTPDEFREEPVRRYGPDRNGPYRDGLHTLSAAGGVTLVDAKTEAVDWRVIRLRWKSRLAARFQSKEGQA